MYFTGCRTSAHNFIRKIMALPFLPEAEIQPIFQRLQLEATGQLLQFTQYVSSMWIHGTTWSPVDWTVFRHAISYAPTAILRGGTMASITEPLDVASCRCTFLSSSFTERLCWQQSRSAWCLRRNWGEYSAAHTAICRQRSSSCGTSLNASERSAKSLLKPTVILVCRMRLRPVPQQFKMEYIKHWENFIKLNSRLTIRFLSP